MESKHQDLEDDSLSVKLNSIKLSEKEAKLKYSEEKVSVPSTRRASAALKEEAILAEAKLDLEVEREWKQVQNGSPGKFQISSNPRAKKISDGLIINHMNMKCADTGRLMWQTDEWADDVFTSEQEARIPAAILKCNAVSREINFTSKEEIKKFRLEQRIFLDDSCIEEWIFEFGFVIPGSTNTWQQTIESAGEGNMLKPEQISGKVTIETGFYDGDLSLAKTVYRIFYV